MTRWRIYLLCIATLPIVEGLLRVRLGAAWEPSVILALLLLMATLLYAPAADAKPMAILFVGLLTLITISNLAGYFGYARYQVLDELKESQIQSVEARMFVETLRFIAAMSMLILTVQFVNDLGKLATVLKCFLIAALAEAAYGVYEFVVKITGTMAFMPLLHGRTGSFLTNPRVYGTFFEPSQFGQFMLVALCLYFAYLNLGSLLQIRDLLTRLRRPALMLLFLALMLSISRTAFVVAIVVVLTATLADFLTFQRDRWRSAGLRLLAFAAVAAIAAALAWQFVPPRFRTMWLFRTFMADSNVADENTGTARVTGMLDIAKMVGRHIVEHPLGIGQGSAIIEYGQLGFVFRLPVESGMILYALFCLLLCGVLVMMARSRLSWSILFPSYVAVVLVQINYSSTAHAWIWFVIALLYAAARLVADSSLAERPGSARGAVAVRR